MAAGGREGAGRPERAWDPAGDAAPAFTPMNVDPAAEVVRTLPRAPGLLERLAVRFLRRRAPRAARPLADPVHILTRSERMDVRRIVESTVFRAFGAGVTSALVVASTKIYVEYRDLPSPLLYVAGAVLVTAVGEILFLHRHHLLAMLSLMRATGARFDGEGPEPDDSLAHAMARAALDQPDPVKIVEGIDPWRETSLARLYLFVVAYKLKRFLSKFAAEILVKRAAPNAVIRVFAPAIALPVTGAWNAFVSWKILREARIRVVGPSAVEEVFSRVLPPSQALSEACRLCLFRAAGMGIVLKRSVHPNLLALLEGLVRRLGPVPAAYLDDRARFLEGLARLAREEQIEVLQVLQVAMVIDGRLLRRERELVRQARVMCGLPEASSALERLLHRFSRGDRIDADLLGDLAR